MDRGLSKKNVTETRRLSLVVSQSLSFWLLQSRREGLKIRGGEEGAVVMGRAQHGSPF